MKRSWSTSVRLALGCGALFAVSALLLVGFLWWRTAGYFEDRAELRAVIVDTLCWAGATALLLAIGGGLLLRHAVLRRVEQINAAAAAIVRGDLTRRVPSADTPDAFDQLARTVNIMLTQIQQLVEGVKNTSKPTFARYAAVSGQDRAFERLG